MTKDEVLTKDEEILMLRGKLNWIRRNIMRAKDFAFYGDTYRDGVNNTVDYIVADITECIGPEEDPYDSQHH